MYFTLFKQSNSYRCQSAPISPPSIHFGDELGLDYSLEKRSLTSEVYEKIKFDDHFTKLTQLINKNSQIFHDLCPFSLISNGYLLKVEKKIYNNHFGFNDVDWNYLLEKLSMFSDDDSSEKIDNETPPNETLHLSFLEEPQDDELVKFINERNILELIGLAGGEELIELSESEEPVGLTESEEPVELTENQEPVGLTESQEPVELTESEEPVELTENQEPVGLTDSQEPVELTENQELIEPTEIEESIELTESQELVELTEIGEPIEPTDSQEPIELPESQKLIELTESQELVQITESGEPVELTESEEPVEQTESQELIEPTDSEKRVEGRESVGLISNLANPLIGEAFGKESLDENFDLYVLDFLRRLPLINEILEEGGVVWGGSLKLIIECKFDPNQPLDIWIPLNTFQRQVLSKISYQGYKLGSYCGWLPTQNLRDIDKSLLLYQNYFPITEDSFTHGYPILPGGYYILKIPYQDDFIIYHILHSQQLPDGEVMFKDNKLHNLNLHQSDEGQKLITYDLNNIQEGIIHKLDYAV